ncbi:MAG TPA: hypothetical protein VLH13_01205 [Methanomassiliicoccales archaeon]|nr:hypothetical protein [Methanomassiliicoccales archaeon]
MSDPEERIHTWSDAEVVDELSKLTGDVDRDVEREAMRRLMEKVTRLIRETSAKT